MTLTLAYDTPAARDALILRYLPLAQAAAARRHRPVSGLSAEDLEQEATAALVEAVDAYDVGSGISLATFAEGRIRNALNRSIDRASPCPMSRKLERAARKCRAAKSALMADGVIRPTLAEIAERAGLDVATARKSLRMIPMPPDWLETMGLLPPGADSRSDLARVVAGGLALCTELGRQLLELMGEYDLTVGQAAYRLGVPYRQAVAEHRRACATLAAHARAEGFDESRYAAAIA